mmetsp:Transcript_29709/g.73614  ORF Transcript_29709/g.73614 Transcript_29709/m.73614 type:complete len:401 (-) Transcript_29709:278-1480(-)
MVGGEQRRTKNHIRTHTLTLLSSILATTRPGHPPPPPRRDDFGLLAPLFQKNIIIILGLRILLLLLFSSLASRESSLHTHIHHTSHPSITHHITPRTSHHVTHNDNNTCCCINPAPPSVALVGLGGVVEVELGGADGVEDDVEDAELPGGERADHHAARAQPLRAQLHHARLGGDVDQAGHHAALAARARLVHLGQQGVRRVRDDGGAHARHDTRRERHRDVLTLGHLRGGLAEGLVDLLRRHALHRELGHGVRHLLEQDGPEAAVERRHHALLRRHLAHGAEHAVGVRRVGHQADAGGLERAQEHVRDGLGDGGGAQVDGVAVVPRLLLRQVLGRLHLEELHASELEPALHEVPEGGGAQPREQRACALLRDGLLEPADHAGVLGRVQLHARLHHVHRA